MFTEEEVKQITQKGISPETLSDQLIRFEEGFPALEMVRPATIGNGILKLSDKELDWFADKYASSKLNVLKFVPASGAATRMFKSLFAFLDLFERSNENAADLVNTNEDLKLFFNSINKFAFYHELNEKMVVNLNMTIEQAIEHGKLDKVVDQLLESSGLNYGNLPKGLLSFHNYKNYVRTPAQEHLAECLDYTEKDQKASVHFTISPAHRQAFEKHIVESIDALQSDSEIEVTFSEQFSSTDTLASTTDFKPFRDEKSQLLFRPAGHGALLSNLNDLSSDLIFIKNIDNVVPDYLRAEGTKYKKAIAGVLLKYRERIFGALETYDKNGKIGSEGVSLLHELGVRGDFSDEEVVKLLDRPLRVCGMVKNEGEPGGGPFWVKGANYDSLQIVESAQVDKTDDNQIAIFNSGTHFNPVDIVCSIKNHKGEKYDLLNYRDEDSGFIAEKSYNGQKLLAMELPGLWNGSMANWNTVFVEVPLSTFNPVKTVNDLLKPNHR